MPGGEKCLAAGEARSRAVRSALRQAGRSAAFTIAASGVVLRGAGSGAGRDATPISPTGDPHVGIVVKGSFALNTAAPATDITDSYSYYVSIWAKGPYSPQPGFNPSCAESRLLGTSIIRCKLAHYPTTGQTHLKISGARRVGPGAVSLGAASLKATAF